MDKKREKPQVLPEKLPQKPGIVEPIIAAGEMVCDGRDGITSDVDGSYTGRPLKGGLPVQDADDL